MAMVRRRNLVLSITPSTLLMLICFGSVAPARAQQAAAPQPTPTPQLLQRSQNPDSPAKATAKKSSAQSTSNPSQPCTLPADISGAYAFDRDNESIEIDIDQIDIDQQKQQCKLTGYITRLGDQDTDATTPLTYFFSSATVDGSQLKFATRVVHGIGYSFTGTILRGRSVEREDEGYYVLQGQLVTHHVNAAGDPRADSIVEKRAVRYRSLGRYAP